MDDKDYLYVKKRRFVSNTTSLICSRCGETSKVSNTEPSDTITVEKTSDNYGCVIFKCTVCNEQYELAITKIT